MIESKLKGYKDEFLQQEFWILTFGGAFQHAGVYLSNKNNELEKLYNSEKPTPTKDRSTLTYNQWLEETKKAFKKVIKNKCKDLLCSYADGNIDEHQHISNIKELANETAKKQFSKILTDGKINFGVAQKLLNLYLKYNWTLGEVETPPHFPVDRIIQEKLLKICKENKINGTFNKVEAWTNFKDEKHYKNVVRCAEKVAKEDTQSEYKLSHRGEIRLAEIELILFDRRENTKE